MLKSNLRFRARIGKRLSRLGLESFYELNLRSINGLILDIGCGEQEINYGNLGQILKLDIKKSRAVDIVADTHSLPFQDNVFDGIICKEVLEHLYHPHKAINEMRSVLKPRGKLVASTCFYWPIHAPPIDYFRFTRFGLQMLFEHWSQVSIHAKNGLLGTLGTHLVRVSNASSLIIKILYPLIIINAFFLILFDRLSRYFLSYDFITSGYLITAIKPTKSDVKFKSSHNPKNLPIRL